MRIEKKGKKKCHFTSVWSSSEIGRNRPFISEDCLNFGRLSPMLQISHLQTSLTERGDRHQAARRADINHHHARSLVSLDRLSLHKIKRIHEGSRVFFPRWSRSRIITSRCSVIKSDFKARTCNCQSLGAAAAPPPRIRLNWLPTILCHISPTLQTSKRLLNCHQMTITNMMQWLPPKDSICQQACSAVSRSPRAGIRFPTTPRDIPRADFHLVVTACTIAHSLI